MTASAAVVFGLASAANAGSAGSEAIAFGDFLRCRTTPIVQMSKNDIMVCDAMERFSKALAKAQAEESANPRTPRRHCYDALPQYRDGCDKKFDAEIAEERKTDHERGFRDGWRIAPPPR